MNSEGGQLTSPYLWAKLDMTHQTIRCEGWHCRWDSSKTDAWGYRDGYSEDMALRQKMCQTIKKYETHQTFRFKMTNLRNIKKWKKIPLYDINSKRTSFMGLFLWDMRSHQKMWLFGHLMRYLDVISWRKQFQIDKLTSKDKKVLTIPKLNIPRQFSKI